MSQIIQVRSGEFGRVALLDLDEPLVEHAHSEGHLLFCLDGPSCSMNVGNQIVPLSGEYGVAINSWETHTVTGDDTKKQLFLAFYLEQNWLTSQYEQMGATPIFASPSIYLTASIQRVLQSIFSLLLTSNDPVELELNILALMEEIISESTSLCSVSKLAIKMNKIPTDFRIRKAIDYMREHIDERPTFDNIARETALSRPHFFSLFRKHMHMTPSVFWNVLRIENSIKQLTTTDSPLSEVSHTLGFTEPGNFSRFFKSHVGVSPSEYRHAVGN